MTASPEQLHASDVADGPDLDEAVQSLSRFFRVQVGPRRAVRRTQLDTFDRRLGTAGLRLELEVATTGGGSTTLILQGEAEPERRSPVGALTPPLLAADLPPGAVRDRVAPVMGIRALIAGTVQGHRLRRAELRNADDKLVVVLELDEPTGPPERGTDASARDVRVTVHPLRGYQREAQRAVRDLGRFGLRPAGPHTSVSDAKPPTDVSTTAPATELLEVVLGDFLSTMRKNLDGLVADIDTEFLHDFRVAVRRTRSTLKLSREVLPEGLAARWEPQFKWLGDLTTPVRDLDVYELDLPAMRTWLVGASPSDLSPFESHLRRRRTVERRALLRGLRSARFAKLLNEWEQAVQELGGTEPDQPTAGDLAARSIRRSGRRVLRDGHAVHADSPAEALHSLRKRCKELRYALEVFAPVVDVSDRKRLVADLKVLQDVLGRFQDTEVQRTALRGFAAEMMADGTPAEAVLAMGELIGHLDAAQDDARHGFDDAFARLARPASQQRLSRLGGQS